jgi:dihydrofolate reductase
MGRKTFESIGGPLKGRLNIILSRQENYEAPGAHVFGDLNEALQFAASEHSEVFIIGGQELYEQTLNRADRLYVTYIREKNIEGDTFFPFWDRRDYRVIQKEGKGGRPEFEVLQRVLSGEPSTDPRAGFANPEAMAYYYGGGI